MKWPDDFINKIICGDCLKVMKEMPSSSIDFCIADPPFNVGINYGGNFNDKCKIAEERLAQGVL